MSNETAVAIIALAIIGWLMLASAHVKARFGGLWAVVAVAVLTAMVCLDSPILGVWYGS